MSVVTFKIFICEIIGAIPPLNGYYLPSYLQPPGQTETTRANDLNADVFVSQLSILLTGIRASIFNRCNDATMKIREVPLVHATSLLYHVYTVASRNKWFNSSRTSGKFTSCTPIVQMNNKVQSFTILHVSQLNLYSDFTLDIF